jgi:hypothetical protein
MKWLLLAFLVLCSSTVTAQCVDGPRTITVYEPTAYHISFGSTQGSNAVRWSINPDDGAVLTMQGTNWVQVSIPETGTYELSALLQDGRTVTSGVITVKARATLPACSYN